MGVREGLSVIGAFVGGVFGNAQIGFAIGSILGSWLDPEVIDGPRVGDVAQQTSAEGVPCPLFAGTAGAAGNLIYKGPVDPVYTNEGGKGAPPEQRVKRLYCTFAIRVGASLFTRPGHRTSKLYLLKLWEMEKLVYDVSPESTILEESEKYAEENELAFYPGDEAQLPDPLIEAIEGVGNVPAYRGRAYFRMRKDLTDYRGAVPQFRVEVAVDGVETQRLALVTATRTFSGNPDDLEVSAADIGFNSAINLVAVSPSGRWAIGSDINDNGSHRLQIFKYDFDALTWSALAAPAYIPTFGPYAIAWHPDEDFVAIGHGGDNNVTLYARSGDTFTAQAAPTDVPPNAVYSLDWDADGHRLACGVANTGFPLVVYDFISGELVNYRTTSLMSLGDPGLKVAWMPTPGARYVALGGADSIAVFDDTDDLRLAASLADLGDADAGAGIHWDRSLGYLITVGQNNGPNYVRIWDFDYSAAGTESLTFVAAAPDQPSNTPAQSAITRSREHLAVAVTSSATPLILSLEGVPPVPTEISAPAAATSLSSVSWTDLPALPQVDVGEATLDDVIIAAGRRIKMASATFDVAHLSGDIVRGLVVASQGYTTQDLLNALRWVYLLDGADYDEQLHFPKRGGVSAFTITDDDLVDEQDDGEQNETLRNGDDKRQASIRRPLKLNLMFPNRTVGYQLTKATSPHYADRGDAVSEVTLQVPVVLRDTDEAPQLADKLEKISRADAEGEIVRIVHEGVGAELTPGDVGTMTDRGVTRRVRIESTRDSSGTKRLLMRVDRPHAYQSQIQQQAVPAPPAPPPSLPGATQFVVLNMPGRIDSDDQLGIVIGVQGLADSAWAGTLVRYSTNGGVSWTNLTTITQRAQIGTLIAELPAASRHYTDRTNVLQVEMLDDRELETLTQTELLNEGNPFAIAYPDGTAEVGQFRDAADEGDNVWSLSHLFRGRLNTATDEHLIGAKFVMLAGTVFVPLPSSLIGRTITLQFISDGLTADSAPTFTFEWDPVHAQTEWEPADVLLERDGDTISAEVIPRGRFGSEMNPIASQRLIGYRFTATDGVNTTTVDTGLTTKTASFDVTGWSSPVTVEASLLNHYTGEGPSTSEAIA